MKKTKKISNLYFIPILFIVGSITIYFFFINHDPLYSVDNIGAKISWMITITTFMVIFYILLFLINYQLYLKVFVIILTAGASFWVSIYFLDLFNINLESWNFFALQDFGAIISFSIFPNGIIIYFIHYIRKRLEENRHYKVIKNTRIHEGFVGIIFLLIGLALYVIRLILIQNNIIRTTLRIFVAIEMVSLSLFLFSGSFLIFRDWNDVLRLKFIEKMANNNNNENFTLNQNLKEKNNFFTFSKVKFYPIGILLNCISVNIFIHGNDYLLQEFIHLTDEFVVFLGVIGIFIAGGMVGRDWYRLFAQICPDLYQKIEQQFNS